MTDDLDIWQDVTTPPMAQVKPLKAPTQITDIAPLDDSAPDAYCATALQEALFGQPPGAQGDVHIYALLDAAKVANLREMIELSGLDHGCLFSGPTFDELADVAPWLVRLEPGYAFTRRLFEKGDAPWELWDRDAGIFLRSALDLDSLRRHLKKFTKARDGAGQTYFVRFWEPGWTVPLIKAMTPGQAHKFLEPLHAVICHTGSEAVILPGGAQDA